MKKYVKASEYTEHGGEIRPNWRGCKDIDMVWYGNYSDPSLLYNGYEFNYWDIEDALWSDFLESTGHKDSESSNPEVEKEFNEWLGDGYAESYLDDVLFGGYFRKGYTNWIDQYRDNFKN